MSNYRAQPATAPELQRIPVPDVNSAHPKIPPDFPPTTTKQGPELQLQLLDSRTLESRQDDDASKSSDFKHESLQRYLTPQNATSVTDTMHHLPDPALTLTIPSIHDGTVLDCRIYHPLGLETSLSSAGASASSWRPKNAAIIAHPYAPLGGSYDDPIVDEVAGYLLAREFIVGTFNFRYAPTLYTQGWDQKRTRGI